MQVVEFYSPSFEYFLSIYLWKDCNIYNMLCDKTFSIFWYHIIVHIASIFFHIIFIGIEKLILKFSSYETQWSALNIELKFSGDNWNKNMVNLYCMDALS